MVQIANLAWTSAEGPGLDGMINLERYMRSQFLNILTKAASCCGLAFVLGAGFPSATAQAAVQSYNLNQGNGFVVADVRLQGLQRVSAGTVFNIIPIGVGDRVDNVTVRAITGHCSPRATLMTLKLPATTTF